MNKTNLVLAAVLSFLAACNSNSTAKVKGATYFDVAGMDTTVKPGDNFFQFANGGWVKATTIPDDQSGWGSFYTLYTENQQKLKAILEEAANNKNAAKGSLEQKVGDFYASGMDTAALEQKGAQPLMPVLQKIDAVKTYQELVALNMELDKTNDGSLIGYYVGADEKNSTINILNLYQTGLTLPEKEYYTRKDSTTTMQRQKMVEYATKLYMLTGADSTTAAKQAADVLKLETEIAKSHLLPTELRDPVKNYNKMTIAELEKLSPKVGWSNVFSTLGLKVDSLNVGQPKYYAALSTLLATQPIEAWKSKMKFDYISGNTDALSKAFRDASFEFGKTFSGQKVQKERWKTIVDLSDNGLKDLLSQLYVKKHFTPEAKQRMDELVNNLQEAFKNRLNKLDWMSDSTRQKALAKLNTIMKKIGYPDKWKSYDDVKISRNNFFENNQAIGRHDFKENIEKIGKPVDKSEWGMTPATVNAYYNPTFNEIVFPAGILQWPFFDAGADDAINYGGIGMVIGHEITHGFDDQGRQYDAEGNLKDWWTSGDANKFNTKAEMVIKEYDNYTIFDSVHLNGKLTLGENLADIGGLAIAYDAFKMTEQGKSNEKIDGFTPDQRFFLGFAQVWRIMNRDETMRVRVTTDPHSPELYRVNGPLSNFEPFYSAFNVKPGDKMYKPAEQRAKIW
ncbi:M13 family metallopeptidase [Aridibaculum aurantiacum]|uniref:M13 family metallopeptidase n=1 Tax=Aridibaculum aurantiacum TaxID=2810307 RepID=UPI001A962E12|nr:M13 family metallopeptidase [Aridibaculum aurantiacum]